MASRSPRRFRDGAAKFDWCTVIRVARCRGEAAVVVGFGGVDAGRLVVAAKGNGDELTRALQVLSDRRTLRLTLRFTLQRSELQIGSCDGL